VSVLARRAWGPNEAFPAIVLLQSSSHAVKELRSAIYQ